MVIQIFASVKDNSNIWYQNNVGYLQSVKFQGEIDNYAPDVFVFNKKRTDLFIRAANFKITEDVTTRIGDVLPKLTTEDIEQIEEAFAGILFRNTDYGRLLDKVGKQLAESVKMLIFNEAQQYVAHVALKSFSRRTELEQFTVDFLLTCQRFTYFQPVEIQHSAAQTPIYNVSLANQYGQTVFPALWYGQHPI